MARQRLTLSGTFAADAYRNLLDLFGLPANGQDFRVLEGFVNVQGNGATFRMGDQAAPATALGGFAVATGAAFGVGPAKDPDAAWDLGQLWARNTTAGSNATVVFVGVVEVR